MLVVKLAITLVFLVLVPTLTAIQLRKRRFRWLLVPASVLFHILVGNLVSRLVLVSVFYPRGAVLTETQLEVRQILLQGTSLTLAAGVTLVVFAIVRRLLPRTEPPATR